MLTGCSMWPPSQLRFAMRSCAHSATSPTTLAAVVSAWLLRRDRGPTAGGSRPRRRTARAIFDTPDPAPDIHPAEENTPEASLNTLGNQRYRVDFIPHVQEQGAGSKMPLDVGPQSVVPSAEQIAAVTRLQRKCGHRCIIDVALARLDEEQLFDQKRLTRQARRRSRTCNYCKVEFVGSNRGR